MKKPLTIPPLLSCVALAFCFLSIFAQQANAWGYLGHRIIAQVAAQYLSPQARQEVAELLGLRTLADVANDPDEWRSTWPETSSWHFVNIPFDESSYDVTRDCPHGDCVIAAIARYREVLADRSQRTAARTEALIFLVHLVGDVHQPCHCIDNHDRGGNDVAVTFFGQSSPEYNLHSVWDSHLIHRTRLGERAYVYRLMTLLASRHVEKLQRGTIVDWALESHKVAKEHAYRLPPDRNLRAAYYSANLPVLDNQLAKAGIRLARVLTEALQ